MTPPTPDACHYLRERNAAMDRYSEVTYENGHLEIALSTSQDALAATKGETNAVWVELATSDASVAGKFFKIILYLITLFC